MSSIPEKIYVWIHEFAHTGRVKYVLQTENLLSCIKWAAKKTFKPTKIFLRWLFSQVHHSAVVCAVTQFIKKLLLALVSFMWSANIVIAICSCEPEWQHKKQVKQTIFLLQHAICAFYFSMCRRTTSMNIVWQKHQKKAEFPLYSTKNSEQIIKYKETARQSYTGVVDKHFFKALSYRSEAIKLRISCECFYASNLVWFFTKVILNFWLFGFQPKLGLSWKLDYTKFDLK